MPETLMTVDDVNRLDPYRLPRHIVPRRYRLVLEPDLLTATFDGRVEITADVTESSMYIVLNSIDLAIERVNINGKTVRHSLDPDNERLIVHLSRRIDPGTVAIDITFSGALNDKLRGFYRSTYVDHAGRPRTVATTQMQSTDCRRAFPCFDEPDFKAVFSVTLIAEPTDLALSNGPEVDRQWIRRRSRNKEAVTFADTMPMSTYLVAFVVGPLDATPPVDVAGVPIRIVHPPGKGHLTAFGLDVAAKSLKWFVEYYGIPYPDAKIDLVALPDFAAGAMENLGCITFRESLLLVDPVTSTQMEQQNVADVVSHELAHMWFGDLVTMRWWNGIWLNEAFATFMEVASVDDYRPEWARWTNFSLERSIAFETDSLSSTRSVEFEVRSPQDCEGMFDVLTYQKGGALLRMLEQYLGANRFRDGIRRYLKTHSYGNTDTSDLWDSIEAAASSTGSEPVRAMMDSWIWQPGYPLIEATVDRSLFPSTLILTQSRFGYSHSRPDAETENGTEQTWIVPVHLRVGDREAVVLLDRPQVKVSLGEYSDRPVVVNAGGFGYYRVAYSPDMLAKLRGKTLASMATIERYTLVDDAWNSVIAGRMSASDFLTFLEAFSDEHDYPVWQCIAQGLRGIARLVDDSTHEALQKRIHRLVEPAFKTIGWDPVPGERGLVSKLRGLLVALLAIHGNDLEARTRCRDIFHTYERNSHSVHPELAAAATTVVAAIGDADDYEHMVDRYLTSENPQEQLRYLYALCEFDDPTLISRTCDFAMSKDVKTQNAPFVLARCIAARKNGIVAWEFVKSKWTTAVASFPSNTIIRMVDPIKYLNTPESYLDATAFFRAHPIPQAAKTLDQIMERHAVNTELRSREEPLLREALAPSGTTLAGRRAKTSRINLRRIFSETFADRNTNA